MAGHYLFYMFLVSQMRSYEHAPSSYRFSRVSFIFLYNGMLLYCQLNGSYASLLRLLFRSKSELLITMSAVVTRKNRFSISRGHRIRSTFVPWTANLNAILWKWISASYDMYVFTSNSQNWLFQKIAKVLPRNYRPNYIRQNRIFNNNQSKISSGGLIVVEPCLSQFSTRKYHNFSYPHSPHLMAI